MKMSFVLSVMVCQCLFASVLYAAEPAVPQEAKAGAEVKKSEERKEAPVALLEEVVVTASKTPVEQSKVTQKVDVISSEEIEQLTFPNRNLSEIFKYQPGTFVNPLSRNDANWGSYGGFGPKYSVYMLDGLPIDSFVDPMSLDSIYLDRAEVYRGPASVLYPNYMSMDFAGNQSSLTGISNLITKERISQPMTSITGGYGYWNTITGRVYHQDAKGDFHYFIGASYEQSDYHNYGTNPSWLNMIDDPDYKKVKLYGKVTWFLTPEQKVSVFVNHTTHIGDAGRPNRGFENQYDLVNFAYENRISQPLTINFKVGYRYYNRKWEEDNFPVLSLREKDGVTQNIVPADLSVAYKHLKDSVLTIGTDMQYVTYKTFSEPGGVRSVGNDMTARSHGVYIQEQLKIDKWVFRAGGRLAYTRHDYELLGGVTPGLSEKSWLKPLWSGGVRYNVTERIGVYANAGSSYITPSAKSVGGTLSEADLGVPGRNGQLPNASLKPESGMGFDVGADAWVFNNLKVGVRGFLTMADDAIVDVVVSNTPSQTRSINSGKAQSMGVELDVKHMLSRYLAWFANSTFTESEIKESLDPNQVGAAIAFVPKWISNVGFTAKLPYDFSVSPYYQYIGTYYDSTDKTNRSKFGNYWTINLKAQKQLYKGKAYVVNANVDANNLTNRKYVMPWQFQDPGINGVARLEIRF
jgi:iron complex outermembrane recepter protein